MERTFCEDSREYLDMQMLGENSNEHPEKSIFVKRLFDKYGVEGVPQSIIYHINSRDDVDYEYFEKMVEDQKRNTSRKSDDGNPIIKTPNGSPINWAEAVKEAGKRICGDMTAFLKTLLEK